MDRNEIAAVLRFIVWITIVAALLLWGISTAAAADAGIVFVEHDCHWRHQPRVVVPYTPPTRRRVLPWRAAPLLQPHPPAAPPVLSARAANADKEQELLRLVDRIRQLLRERGD